jgi:hypothetical protein
VNQVPVASPDSFSIIENTPTILAIFTNDTDSDGTLDRTTAGVDIIEPPAGHITIGSGNVTYTPPDGFTGTDTFTYRVRDNDGAISNAATVTVTVNAITTTTLTATPLTIPQTGYVAMNNAVLNGTFLTSPALALAIPPNTIAFSLNFRGDAVNRTGLRITEVSDPDGNIPNPLERHVVVCDPSTTLCTASRPRRPDQVPTRGNWHFRLGTSATTLTGVDFSKLTLELVTRVGPKPNPSAQFPGILRVKPFLSAPSVSSTQLAAVLARLVAIANESGIQIDLMPITVLTTSRFAEVPASFDHPDTAALVSLGDADAANIFFIESFRGIGGQIGLAPGIPGTLGVKSPMNGVLINATITLQPSPADYYARTTAEFAFHELAHMLGLFHTTERNFNAHDILDDTSECGIGSDLNRNGRADVNECDDGLNLMFWNNAFGEAKLDLTPDQRWVLTHSLIARP